MILQIHNEIVISDTSCLILLSKINQLELLKSLYNHVFTTKEISEEFGEEFPKWIQVKNVRDINYQKILSV